jgi:hypothetical protein
VALSAPEPIAPTTRLGILPLVLFPSTTGSNGARLPSKWRGANVRRVRGGQGHRLLCLGVRLGNCCRSGGTLPAQYARADPLLWCSRRSPLIALIMVAASAAHRSATPQGASCMRPMQSGSVALSCTQSRMLPRPFTLRSDLSRHRLIR